MSEKCRVRVKNRPSETRKEPDAIKTVRERARVRMKRQNMQRMRAMKMEATRLISIWRMRVMKKTCWSEKMMS